MKTRVLTLGLVLVGVAAACGGSSSDDTLSAGSGGSGGGSAGSSGKAGTAGSSGAAGKAGAGGSAGSAGTGGASAGAAGTAGASGGGAAGAAGTAGKGGGGGASGTAGASGASGTAGVAGSAGKAGAAGAAGTGGAAGSAGNAGSGGGTVDPNPVTFCSATTDCTANQTNKVCDPTVGKCVGCLPSSDTCPKGQYCQPATKQCASGCADAGDCAAPTPLCDTATNSCKACLLQTDCASGKICVKGACTTGCDGTKPCATAGESCCDASCHDLKTDVNNCGKCGVVCADANNAKGVCKDGACAVGSCAPGFADCNLDPSDGCEVNTALGGACVCKPGETKPCYTGPAGTEGKGTCKGGVQQCAPSGLGYLPGCIGQVLPQPEQCGSQDLDCDGAAGNVPDVDGDGWTACQGDCCENTTQCATPKTVNPGAYDIPADGTDNDCDGTVDNPLACGGGAKLNGVTPQDGATAIELCQTTTASPPINDKKWGVLNAQWLLADGSTPSASALSDIQSWQAAVLNNYGVNQPRKGSTLLGLSNGKMRTPTLPGWPGSPSSSFSTAVQPPTVYTGAHGGNLLPGTCGAKTCPVGNGANDSVNLRLTIRVPTNAPSFTYDFRFFSMEYYTYQCTSFNDYFLALITTGAAGIPTDHNISFDANGSAVSVNNGFFQVCGSNGKGCGTCPNGTGDLSGTGMEAVNGGGTAWLTTKAPVVPGETMVLDLTVFDVSDHILDSLVLVDNWQWLATPSGPPTTKPAQ